MLEQMIRALKRHPNKKTTFNIISMCLNYRNTQSYRLVCQSVIGSYLAHNQITWMEADIASVILKGVNK